MCGSPPLPRRDRARASLHSGLKPRGAPVFGPVPGQGVWGSGALPTALAVSDREQGPDQALDGNEETTPGHWDEEPGSCQGPSSPTPGFPTPTSSHLSPGPLQMSDKHSS